jgi:hypothetical protein
MIAFDTPEKMKFNERCIKKFTYILTTMGQFDRPGNEY